MDVWERSDVRIIGLAWFASRAVYWLAGVRFDIATMDHALQLIDPELLQHDLWRSLFYSHAQPPVWNLLTAITLRLPGPPTPWLALCYLGVGLCTVAMLVVLAARLGVDRRLRLALVGLYAVSPTVVLYEHSFTYTVLVSGLLVAAAFALHRAVEQRRPTALLGFFAAVSAVALTRATYHLVWLLAAAVIPMWYLRSHLTMRQRALVALPLVLVGAVYLKNAVLFDSPATSSWLGMNLAHATIDQVDDAEIDRLVDDGTLHEISRVAAFSPLHLYPVDPRAPTGVPLLDEPEKANGAVNLFDVDYVALSRAHLRDVLAYARARPFDVARGWFAGARWLGLPPSDYAFVYENRQRIRGFDDAWNRVVTLQPVPFDDLAAVLTPRARAPGIEHVQVAWAIVYAASMIGAPALLWRRRRSSRAWSPRDAARLATATFISLTVGFATVANCVLELGENNRFRFETDALALVGAALLVACVADRRRIRHENALETVSGRGRAREVGQQP